MGYAAQAWAAGAAAVTAAGSGTTAPLGSRGVVPAGSLPLAIRDPRGIGDLAGTTAVRARPVDLTRLTSHGGLLDVPVFLSSRRAADGDVVVDVTVRGVANLYGAEIALKFDMAKVTVVDAYPDQTGVQMQPGKLWTDAGAGWVVKNTVDGASGVAEFAATLLAPAPPVSGDRVLFSITLRPKTSAGVSGAIALSKVKLAAKHDDITSPIAVRWSGVDIFPFDGHPIYLPLIDRSFTRK